VVGRASISYQSTILDIFVSVLGEIAGETKPEWKTIKTKLLDLARKYDSAA